MSDLQNSRIYSDVYSDVYSDTCNTRTPSISRFFVAADVYFVNLLLRWFYPHDLLPMNWRSEHGASVCAAAAPASTDLSPRMIDPQCRPPLPCSAPPAGEILPPVEVTSCNNLAEATLLFLFVCFLDCKISELLRINNCVVCAQRGRCDVRVQQSAAECLVPSNNKLCRSNSVCCVFVYV